MKVAIVDLAYGNIGSIQLAFQRLGVEPMVTANPDELAASDRVILPGVGAAGHAMQRIDALGLRGPLKALKQPWRGSIWIRRLRKRPSINYAVAMQTSSKWIC